MPIFSSTGGTMPSLSSSRRGEQVNGQQFGIAVLGGELVRALDGFLRFDGEFVPTDGHGILHLVIG